jgi:hypothetical protein
MATTMSSKGPSFCWHCKRDLVRVKGGFAFSLVRDPNGYDHRVHKQCLPDAVGHGYRALDACELGRAGYGAGDRTGR